MTKPKIIIIVSLALVVTLLFSCFLVYNSLFPKAPPIEIPDPDEVMTFVATTHDGLRTEQSFVSASANVPYLNDIKNAKPTRIMSVNDYPSEYDYFTINYICHDKTYTYYVYSANGVRYVEIPYVGVYILGYYKTAK